MYPKRKPASAGQTRAKRLITKAKPMLLVLNILIAGLSLLNLATAAMGAIQVDIPDEGDFSWVLDSKVDSAEFRTDFSVQNRGPYDIRNLDISADLVNLDGVNLLDYDLTDLVIPYGQTRTFSVEASIPLDSFSPEFIAGLLIQDSSFLLRIRVDAEYMWGLSSFHLDQVIEYPWTAILPSLLENSSSPIVSRMAPLLLPGLLNGEAELVPDYLLSSAMSQVLNNCEFHIESHPIGKGVNMFNGTFELKADLLPLWHVLDFLATVDQNNNIDMQEVSYTVRWDR